MRFMGMWIMIIMLLSFFGIGKALYTDNNTMDIHNYTSIIKWNSTIFEQNYINTTDNMTNSEISMSYLYNVIYKGIDAIGFIAFEVAKWGVEIGFRNPEWNYLWLAKFLVIILIITFTIPLLSILPTLLALIYLAYVGIKNLWARLYKWKKRKK